MNSITRSNANLSSGSTVATAASKTTLGKDDFLKLLTTQLANQDPLDPMDNQAFIAQLAQFSSVEQLQSVSSKLDTMLVAAATTNQLTTAGLVGKSVLYETDRVALTQGQPAELQISLGADAASTTVLISDASGNVVRRLTLGARGAGVSTVSWDGLDASGRPLPSGDYLVSVAAAAADGTTIPTSSRTRGTITGVSFDSGVTRLKVGSGTVQMSDVIEITSPPA